MTRQSGKKTTKPAVKVKDLKLEKSGTKAGTPKGGSIRYEAWPSKYYGGK
jgi:hypothetical protein